MEFFDLNIPFSINETTQKSSTRLKLAIKAMELGYSGVAYNHTIKGVMSESHRCCIPLFPLSSFLKLSSLLSSSVKFHRHLLNVAVSSPFRQYTRLTVIVDSPSQAAALNTGNPVLKTYDIVAVCPVNQNAFEQACLTAQVDIIYIDFSDKPFRLKQPIIKAAIERGVYFEIAYSNLVLDAQGRRQMMSNAKLLVDWTRGKNLIFSSGAPSVTELRGPFDVANLSSLLGLTMERAKAAISKNCRSMIANAIKKKQYYKEAIKVEILPAGGEMNYDDWLHWDPISSGEGDLKLDDLEKSFSTCGDVSKAAKAIDFTSTLNGLPSHGLQIKDMISITKVEPRPSAVDKNSFTAQKAAVADSVCELPEQPRSSSSFPSNRHTSLHCTQTMDQTFSTRKSEISSSSPCTLNNTINVAEEGSRAIVSEELKSSQVLNPTAKGRQDFNSQTCVVNNGRTIVSPDDRTAETCTQDIEIAPSVDRCPSAEISTPLKDLTFNPSHLEDTRLLNNFSAELFTQSVTVDGVTAEIDGRIIKELPLASCDVSLSEGFLERGTLVETEDSIMNIDEFPDNNSHDQETLGNKYIAPKEQPSASYDVPLHEELAERENLMVAREVSVLNADELPVKEHDDEIEVENEYLVTMDEAMEEDKEVSQTLREDHAGTSSKLPGASSSGRHRVKRKASYRSFLLPFKHLLRPRPFKKKARKLH